MTADMNVPNQYKINIRTMKLTKNINDEIPLFASRLKRCSHDFSMIVSIISDQIPKLYVNLLVILQIINETIDDNPFAVVEYVILEIGRSNE